MHLLCWWLFLLELKKVLDDLGAVALFFPAAGVGFSAGQAQEHEEGVGKALVTSCALVPTAVRRCLVSCHGLAQVRMSCFLYCLVFFPDDGAPCCECNGQGHRRRASGG